MNILLIFFAIPIAVIILSTIFETYMRNPFKVAGVFFSIFLVLAVYLGGTAEYVIAALVYTLLSFISAYIVELICTRRCINRNDYSNEYNKRPEIINSNTEFELPSTFEIENNEESFNNCYRGYR